MFGKLRPNLRKSIKAPFPGYCSTDILVLCARAGVRPDFAAHVFQWEPVFVAASTTAAGTKMPRTSWNELKNFRVFKPSSEAEQSRIAAVLDTVDEATAKTEAVIAKLRQVRAGLLHDLLTRGLDEHGQPRDPIAHPEQFKDSPLGRIPREWEVMPIQQAALDTPGATVIGPFGSNLLADDYRSKGVPVVFVRDIKADTFQWNSGVYIEPQKARELSAHSVEPGDQRATKMGLPPCIACPYPEWMPPGIVTADIIRLRPDLRKTTARWLSILVNSDAVARQVRAITGGVTRPKVTLPDFRTLTIALPSLQEQQGIVSILDFHDTRIRAEETHRNKLEAIKRGLMHDLLTGRVRVPA